MDELKLFSDLSTVDINQINSNQIWLLNYKK